MKNNIILIGFLGVLFVCIGADEKNSGEPGNFENTTAEEMVEKKENNEPLLNEEEKIESFDVPSKEGVPNSSNEDEETSSNSGMPEESMYGETSGEVPKNPATTQPTEASDMVLGDEVDKKKKSCDPIIIFMEVVPDEIRFNLEKFTVTAGQEVIIELENLDGMQHNLLISKPGTLEIVGAAADVLARDPRGALKNYVPEISEVLFATEMLDPGDFATLKFIAPKEPGEYPFVCTFPGHWRMMNGVMIVT